MYSWRTIYLPSLKLLGQSILELSVAEGEVDWHDLWPTDLNINRAHLLIKDYLPTKFEASGAKRSWVISCTRWSKMAWPLTLTFDLLTWKSIGIIYSLYLPSLKLLGQSVLELSVAQGEVNWHDLWPWPLTWKSIGIIYSTTKFEASWAKRSWVISCTRWSKMAWPLTLTFDLLTWKSIGIIYSPRTINLPSLQLPGKSVLELSVAQGEVNWHDLWPTDLKINRDHLLTKDYQPTKFEASWAKRSWVISCTRWSKLAWPLTLTFDLKINRDHLLHHQVWSFLGKAFLSYQLHKVK